MSGFKEKTWKKWKDSKTTSPVAVTDKKTTDSISSQRSSSLIRSRKRHTIRNVTDNILAAGNQGIIIPRTPIENDENKGAITNNKDRDTEQKNNFKNKSTSPFNTLAPTNPFYRENVIIVQYGELTDNKANSTTDELWGELPFAEVSKNPKPAKEKGPKGRSKGPSAAQKSQQKPSAPPASIATKNIPPPTHLQTPTQGPPQTASGPSAPSEPPASHDSPPPSGQSQHPRTMPSSHPENDTCDFPECPARGPKQKERLCMAPECPVTLKKAVIKEAKKAMKRSCGKKRKNPLTILGAALMSTFAGHDSSCKLTREEKKALKRMKQVEEDDNDNYNTTTKVTKSKGVQCIAPISQKNDRTHKEPENANKSTACDIPECPIASQKMKAKEFMDKGQLCDIPSCPIKEPAPRKEKTVEPPKGCPSKPCTLKTKDEEFLKQLDPCIFEKLPRLNMTCDQALAEENGGQPRQHHTSAAIKNKYKPFSNKTKEQNKGVKIVAAHVRVRQSSENPFLETIPNPEQFAAANKLTRRQLEENQVNSSKASECQKLVDQQLSVPAFVSKPESDGFEYTRSRPTIARQKEIFAIKTEDNNRQPPRIQFSNVSVNQKDSSTLESAPKVNSTIDSRQLFLLPNESKSEKSAKIRLKEPLENKIKPNHTIDAVSHPMLRNRLMTSETLLTGENGLKSTQSSCLSKSVKDPTITHTVSELQALNDESLKKTIASISITGIAKSKGIEIQPSEVFTDKQLGSAKFGGIAQDFPVTKSYSLISKSDFKTQKSGSLKFDSSSTLEDKWPVVVPVEHSLAYDAICDQILTVSPDLPTPRETSAIKILQQNWNTPKNSSASLTGETTSLPPSCQNKYHTVIGKISNMLTEDFAEENSEQKPIGKKFTVREFNELAVNYYYEHYNRKIFVECRNNAGYNKTSQNHEIPRSKPFAVLVVKQSGSGKMSDYNRFKKVSFKIFVTEPITIKPRTKSKPENDCDLCLSETMPEPKNIAQVLHKLNEERCSTNSYVAAKSSREVQFKKPVISLHANQDIRGNSKLHNHMTLDTNISEPFRNKERKCNVPPIMHGAFAVSSNNPAITPNQAKVSTAQSTKLNKSKASNETSTQTLATSAVFPNEHNTIGVGGSTMIDLKSKSLAS